MPGIDTGVGIGSTIKDDFAGIAGQIAHATITFPSIAGEGSNSGVNCGNSTGSGSVGGLSKIKNTLKGAVEKVGGMAMPNLAANTFQVQFNPASLKIDARGGGRVPKTNFAAEGSGKIEFGQLDPYIVISVNLIFDAVNIQDAFFADKFTISATSILKSAGTVAQVAMGKRWSVQPQVEGFIGALRNVERRNKVTFSWGHMSYTGVLNGVSSKYTMFNPNGDPIRAEVGIRFQCAGETLQENWRDKYINGVNRTSAITTTMMSDQLGNLLNL